MIIKKLETWEALMLNQLRQVYKAENGVKGNHQRAKQYFQKALQCYQRAGEKGD